MKSVTFALIIVISPIKLTQLPNAPPIFTTLIPIVGAVTIVEHDSNVPFMFFTLLGIIGAVTIFTHA